LLTASLLLGQLGGLAHGLSHVQDQDHPHAPCQLCVVYAAFVHAVPATPGPMAAADVRPRPAATAVAAVVAATLS